MIYMKFLPQQIYRCMQGASWVGKTGTGTGDDRDYVAYRIWDIGGRTCIGKHNKVESESGSTWQGESTV